MQFFEIEEDINIIIYDELYDKKKLDTWVLNKRGINPPFNRYNYSYENTLNMICYMLHLLD